MLTPATRSTPNSQQLAKHAEAIRSLRRNAIADIIDIGKHLLAAKPLAGHGNWLSWLKDEFDWSESTARNYMRVAQAGLSATVADLKLPVSSLYQITAPSTPKPVRDEVIKTARKRDMTREEVADLVSAAIAPPRPVAKPEPRPAPAMNGMPADFVQAKQAVEIFVSVSLHLFSRERMEALERLEEPALRERVHDELARIIDQAEALQAKLSAH